MFLGPWDQGGPYDADRHRRRRALAATASGPSSPARRADSADAADDAATRELRRWTHKTIRKVTEDIEDFRFNTMIAALMEFTNDLSRVRESRAAVDAAAWREAIESLVLMMAPPAPHIAEELWERLGKHVQRPPAVVADLRRRRSPRDETVEIAVQVNGKVRDRITLPLDAPEDAARTAALAAPGVKSHTSGKEIARVIYVPNRLLNLIVK